jgi:hypothetical protein
MLKIETFEVEAVEAVGNRNLLEQLAETRGYI